MREDNKPYKGHTVAGSNHRVVQHIMTKMHV